MSDKSEKKSELDEGLQVRLGRLPREPRQVVKYTFFTLDPAWRRLPLAEREAAKVAFARVIGDSVRDFFVLRTYNLIGMHSKRRFHALGGERHARTAERAPLEDLRDRVRRMADDHPLLSGDDQATRSTCAITSTTIRRGRA